MVWRATPEEARQTDGASRKAAFTKRVLQGQPVGILGYVDERRAAWCSIAPRKTYRALGRPPEEPGDSIWSLVCFFIKRDYRGQSIATRLIGAAVEHARQQGATLVEAYPVDPATASWDLCLRLKKRAL